MAKATNINVRVDEDLKYKAEAIFTELGMNLSTAMNLFLHSAVRFGGIPFELKVSRKPLGLEEMSRAEIEAKLEEGLASMKSGKGISVNEFFDK